MKCFYKIMLGILLCAGGISVWAQQTTGEITGTVTDTTGAVVEGARVTATDVATQQVRTTASNDTGNYVLPYLAPGTYVIKCEKTGFKMDSASNLDVTVGAVLRSDFKLEVGEATETVQVNTAAPLLSTESTSVQTNIGSHQIVSLPLNGRDYLQLVALTPNVVNEAQSTGGGGLMGGVRSQESIAIAGQRLEFNHYTLDGVENTDPDFNSYIIHPSVDALQEFTVLTGVYSAEFGRGAGQINATTLPGTNSYHGVAFEFIRNSAVDARQWLESGAKIPFRRNDYGFTLDGPLSIPHFFNAKNKLFFESSFENLHDQQIVQERGNVPTDAQRAGDLSSISEPIYYPWTRGNAGGPTQVSYNGVMNVIPPNDLSSQAQSILNFFPHANASAATYNYINNSPGPTESTQFNQRIDWTQSQKSSWFGRFSWEGDLTANPVLLQQASEAQVHTTVRQAVIGNTVVLSPNMVNDARFAWDQFNNAYAGYYYNSGTDVQSTLGIQGLTSTNGPVTYGVPAIGVSEGFNFGGGVTPWITYDDLFQWIDNVSYIKGNHSMKFGGMFERDRFNNFGNQKSEGEFDFDGHSTNNPANPNTTGFELADFLFGYPSQYYRVDVLPQAELRRPDYAAFFEDDWKVRPNLTLNLGMRYENNRPWYDKYDRIINADIASLGVNVGSGNAAGSTMPTATVIAGAPAPVITRPGAPNCNFYSGMAFEYGAPQQVQCGDRYMGRSTVKPNNFDFGPRIGLNYALGTRWSFRTGFGIFYTNDIGNGVFDMVRNIGGKDGTVVSDSPSARTVTLVSPWASEAGDQKDCPGYNGPCVLAPQIQANDYHNRTPYIEQWMLNVERQLTQNVAVEVGYLGNEAHHLDRDFIVNQAVPKTGPTDKRTTAQRRPFQGYGPIQDMKDWDRASYNALDVKVTQHVSHGLTYVVAFTWGHSIDFGSAVRSNSGDTLWPVNSYNLAAERGNSQFDVRRRFVGSFVYNLPFGGGHGYTPSNAIANHVISGWTVGGILTLADGTPENASTLGDTAGLGTLDNMPFYTGQSYYPSHRTPSHYYNAGAFDYTNPNLSWEQGNMGRDTLNNPGQQLFDANLARSFHIWESHALELRFEAFNALNHANWLPAASSDNRAKNFGVITGANPMRELQGALKYSF